MANQNFGTFNRGGVIADQAIVRCRSARAHDPRLQLHGVGPGAVGHRGLRAVQLAELAGLFFQVQAGRVVGLNVLGWIAIFAPLGLLLLTSFRAAQMSVGVGPGGLLGGHGADGRQPVAAAVPLHRRLGRPHLLRDRGRLRRAEPLRLHDQARPLGDRQVPVHGPGRPDPGQPGEHVLPVGHDDLHHLGRRRADLLGPDRLRHPEDQGAVLPRPTAPTWPRRWRSSARSASTSTSSTCSSSS